jgi:hypothetical protein
MADLIVSFRQRNWDSWAGTADQLTEAGLIPPGFEWPKRTEHVFFTTGRLDCRLQRTRPPGNPRGRWVDVDYWSLVRYSPDRGYMCNAAELWEKKEALRQELWRQSPAGQRMLDRHWTARNDERFQEFKRNQLGLEGRAIIRRKATRA